MSEWTSAGRDHCGPPWSLYTNIIQEMIEISRTYNQLDNRLDKVRGERMISRTLNNQLKERYSYFWDTNQCLFTLLLRLFVWDMHSL